MRVTTMQVPSLYGMAEAEPDIDHGDDVSPQIDDALDVFRKVRQRRDLLNADDLYDVGDGDSEQLVVCSEREVFPADDVPVFRFVAGSLRLA